MPNQNDDNIDQKLVEEFQDAIVEIFQVLRTFGIDELHVGGVMRLLGVSTEVAELYDEYIMVASDIENNSNTEFDVDLSDMPISSIINNSNKKVH